MHCPILLGVQAMLFSQDMREFSMQSQFYLFPSMQTIRRYIALENRLRHFPLHLKNSLEHSSEGV
jgi:hypothetical protein